MFNRMRETIAFRNIFDGMKMFPSTKEEQVDG